MPSMKANIFSTLCRLTGTKKIFASEEAELENHIKNTLHKKEFTEPNKKLYKKCNICKEKIGSNYYYKISPKTAPSPKTILYVHGGGFFMEITSIHWSFICEIACKTSSQIYVPIYPLAPEHSAKDTFDMLLSLYETVLINEISDEFTVMGDSAGGSISLSFAMLLREKHYSRPDHIILISPTVKLTDYTTEEETKIALIDKKDPFLSYNSISSVRKWWSGDLNPSHYYVSPGLGDLHDLGKITLLTGSHDIFSVTCETFYIRAKEENIPIDYHMFENMIHCWILWPTKEGKAGKEIIFKTING